MNSYWIVFLGAGMGGTLRHAINLGVSRALGAAFPFHTLLVNVMGSLAIGLVAGYFATKGESTQAVRLFLTTGILGGFTTFSAFSLDAAVLLEQGHLGSLALYVIGSVGLSLVAVFAGLAIIRVAI